MADDDSNTGRRLPRVIVYHVESPCNRECHVDQGAVDLYFYDHIWLSLIGIKP